MESSDSSINNSLEEKDLSADCSSVNSHQAVETQSQLIENDGILATNGEVDPNYPQVRRHAVPEFPQEYTMETETGLVPLTTLDTIKSHNESLHGVASRASAKTMDVDREGRPEVEYVTFKHGDPENPHNWSRPYKWLVTLLASLLVLAAAFGSSIVTGGLGLIEEKYHVGEEVAILTCSIMVCGFAVGPLLWSPMSEQVGRRLTYAISLSLYVIFNIPCALAPNIGALLACRFICGMFASSALVLPGGSIADVWATEERGMAIAYFAAAPYCGPVLGPIVCGWINIGSGRLDLFFWVNMAFAGACSLAMVLLVPETYAPVILKKRAKKLRKETGNESIMTEQEQDKMTLMDTIRACLIRPVYMMLTEPVLDLMNIYIMLIYSILYAFFFAYPVIFGELHGYNDGIIGLLFIPILIGAGFAMIVTPKLEKMYKKTTEKRAATPEDRLIGAMIGAPFVPISLFILGATSFKDIIWVGPASSGIAFGFGMVLCYYSVNNYIIDSYLEYAASALAAKVFMRSGGGAAFPLFITQMYHRLGDQWASWLLAFISLGMVAIPFGFYRYGGVLRAKLTKS
uniref:ARAD1D46156p n=1 Tax=Blastobotrys adeninivorans TaxID=409370 RepID=A0A060TD96_BLAAD